ncbi:MAG: alpha/beta hydrolase [Planctomycetota bacterium]
MTNTTRAAAALLLGSVAGQSAAQQPPVETLPVEVAGVVVDDGVELRVRSVGAGDAVVLLAGGPGFAGQQMWPIAEGVAEGHRAIVVDQRGTPASPVESFEDGFTIEAAVADLEAVRAAMGLESWTLLGHSWGGLLSMAYAAEHPERVDALVLVSPAGIDSDFWAEYQANLGSRLTPGDLAAMRAVPPPTEQTPDAFAEYLRAMNLAMGPAGLADRSKADLLRAEMTEARFEPRVTLAMQASLATFDFKPRLSGLEAPVTVIQGAADPIGLDATQRILDTIEGSERELIEGAGHWPFLETPGELAELIDDALARDG